jgi:uncharacterized tellurite resistance protein B-like protein
MFEAISRLFTRPEEPFDAHDPKLSVAALLIHLAAVDGEIIDAERQALRGALIDHYDLGETQVDQLIAEATRRDSDAVDFYHFTSAISSLPDEEKIEIIRMMWQVVFADHRNHELEDNMVWRIAELIHVPARQRTILRNQMAKA